jgi:uncharacterized LabA/DUF88 family protein
MRTSFLIDGFNLYHSLKKASYDTGLNGLGTRWLDIRSLCKSQLYLLGKDAVLGDIYYFSALATHMQHTKPGAVSRHQKYIRCLEDSGVTVFLGRFKKKYLWCDRCQSRTKKFEEKESDVAMSVMLIKILMQDTCDAVVIITGDTDIAPALRMAQELFPKKTFGFLFPYNRKNEELAGMTSNFFKLSGEMYSQNQFADPYILKNRRQVGKPTEW